MIRIILEIKFNGNHIDIVRRISEIPYFSSNQTTFDDCEKILCKIRALTLTNRFIKNGIFHDEDNKMVILCLTTAGCFMEIIIQCYSNKANDFDHLVEKKDDIVKYLKTYKKPVFKIFKRKIVNTIETDKISINNIKFFYRRTLNIFNKKLLIPIYFSSIGLFFNFLLTFFVNPTHVEIYFYIFLLSILLNIVAMILLHKLGGNELAYFRYKKN